MAADRRVVRRRRAAHWGLAALLCLPLARAEVASPFDIAPLQPARAIAPDWFGTHFHRLGHAEGGFPATAWPAGQVGAVRLWDSSTRWGDLEPAPGRFDFTRLDAIVDQARAQGAAVSLVLGSPAPWASARPREDGPYGPGSSAEPRDLALWDRYVEAVVHRYRGRIALYELWNEPYFSDVPRDRGQPTFFSGSVATMVELARRARAAIAREDPGARLLTPGFVGGPDRLDLFLRSGGSRYVDGVAYHFYAEGDADFVQALAQVRAVMARDGVAAFPLHDTESGFGIRGVEGQPGDGQRPIDRRRAASLLSHTMILGAWLGLDRFDQYAWDNGRMGMLLPDGRTPTDSARVWAALRRWLIGTTPMGCRAIDWRGVRCEGRRGDRHLTLAWQVDGDAPLSMALPGRVVAIEHATDGPLAAAADPRVDLPSDGMPLAVWSTR